MIELHSVSKVDPDFIGGIIGSVSLCINLLYEKLGSMQEKKTMCYWMANLFKSIGKNQYV